MLEKSTSIFLDSEFKPPRFKNAYSWRDKNYFYELMTGNKDQFIYYFKYTNKNINKY